MTYMPSGASSSSNIVRPASTYSISMMAPRASRAAVVRSQKKGTLRSIFEMIRTCTSLTSTGNPAMSDEVRESR
eukprot:CAMPEP_0174704318 /NCGR_PEP_ID=MMETSP1094-20130205/7958_1 /TAXON_ID=156173 /ORGANISM="Chrysochromulina brevifilum, Strain UTEX LB 985" /LENGTH=73 /DNA_ID=CAMNT_0015902367 /DNA_START=658 /DNA_END=879 /DNA_ORIENTATION=+